MKVLDREIEFDFLDVESMAKYENALEKYMNELDDIRKKEASGQIKEAEGCKLICQTVYTFLDDLIQEGAGTQILGEKMNVRTCALAMSNVLEEKAKSEQSLNDILGKYDIGNIKQYEHVN